MQLLLMLVVLSAATPVVESAFLPPATPQVGCSDGSLPGDFADVLPPPAPGIEE